MGQTNSLPSNNRRAAPFFSRSQHGTAPDTSRAQAEASEPQFSATPNRRLPTVPDYAADATSRDTISSQTSQRTMTRSGSTRMQQYPSRLRRAHRSFSMSLPGVFRRADAATPAVTTGPRPPQPPTGNVTSESNQALTSSGQDGHLLDVPQTSHSDSDLDLDSLSFNRYNGARTDPRPATSDDSRRFRDHRPMSSLANRISSLTPDRGFRQMIRRRRSPARPAENDDTAMLTRMLSVAAAATAASLVGSDSEEAFQDIARTAGIEGDDGTFARFLHTLRTGRLNALLSQENDSISPESAAEANQTSASAPNGLQFFRVFRFGGHSAQGAERRGAGSRAGPTSATLSTMPSSTLGEGQEGLPDARMIPVLMIGIRSLQAEDEQGASTGDGMPSFLDALANFPPADTPQLLNRNSTDRNNNNNASRLARNGVNFSQRRRASMGGFGLLRGSGRDGHGRFIRNADAARSPSGAVLMDPPSTAALSHGSGSYPPPTTPASPPLSTLSSASSTPRRRASVSSAEPRQSSVAQRDSIARPSRTPLESTVEELPNPRPTRARRLSDSDFPRYGSGASRRNGVVEPDRTSTSTDRETNRSWIIYVLGGNYPENHPILMTPSLFTDSPSYEDMLLLSSMLGPAKPPVASAEEVSAAGGLFQTKVGDNGLQLVGGDPLQRFPLAEDEQCLVCLCDFGPREVVRQLNKCKHLFHQECIDQWLTTGRNACPLCRQQGVVEHDSTAEGDETGATVASSAAA